ncbi:MAG TPA: hypothetical protein VKZ89_16665 [Thermobifida alba]|nr:hypothetical protein [Thermobifida alba]
MERSGFFHATPAKVRTLLCEVAGGLLEYTEGPEAAEYRWSRAGSA